MFVRSIPSAVFLFILSCRPSPVPEERRWEFSATHAEADRILIRGRIARLTACANAHPFYGPLLTQPAAFPCPACRGIRISFTLDREPLEVPCTYCDGRNRSSLVACWAMVTRGS